MSAADFLKAVILIVGCGEKNNGPARLTRQVGPDAHYDSGRTGGKMAIFYPEGIGCATGCLGFDASSPRMAFVEDR